VVGRPVRQATAKAQRVNFILFNDIHGLAGNSLLDAVMRFSAQYLLFVVVGVLGLLLLARLRSDGLRRAVQDALWPAAGLLLSYALGLLAAALHPEVRPFTTHPGVHPLIPHHPGQAFPSDHSTAAFAIALVVLAFLSRRIGVALLAAAALIGFSRVYVGVHYPADILASLVAPVLGVGVVFGPTLRPERAAGTRERPVVGPEPQATAAREARHLRPRPGMASVLARRDG
jgi:undecaprenyl-diphosphatase